MTTPATGGSEVVGGTPSQEGAVSGPMDPSGVYTVPASPRIGVPYVFDLLTHCGVVGAVIGGSYFTAEHPIPEGPGGQPTGWVKPYQRGTITLVSVDEAVFKDASGHDLRFRADPHPVGVQPCD